MVGERERGRGRGRGKEGQCTTLMYSIYASFPALLKLEIPNELNRIPMSRLGRLSQFHKHA